MKITLDKLLRCAVETARTTGNFTNARRALRKDVICTKAHDVKLQLDRDSQTRATAVIKSFFPDHRILGEEDASSTTDAQPEFSFPGNKWSPSTNDSDYLWILDPIDGTVNFFRGFPLWCCSVAVAVRGEIVAGAVYSPVMNLCYAAKAGAPATCNGRQIRVSGVNALTEAVIVTGLDREAVTGIPSFALFDSMAEKAQKMRVLGSAAMDLCAVAHGKADAYFEAGIYIWDVAAAGLITRQAGGMSEILVKLPENRLCFLASNGRLQGKLRDLLSVRLKRASRA